MSWNILYGFLFPNLLDFPTVNKVWKSVTFWQSYRRQLVVHFFDTQCIACITCMLKYKSAFGKASKFNVYLPKSHQLLTLTLSAKFHTGATPMDPTGKFRPTKTTIVESKHSQIVRYRAFIGTNGELRRRFSWQISIFYFLLWPCGMSQVGPLSKWLRRPWWGERQPHRTRIADREDI